MEQQSSAPFSPISVRGTSTTNTTTGSSNTVNKPSGVSNGDFLLAFIAYIASTGGGVTPPSGWTALDNTSGSDAVFYKVANAEPSSYSFSISGSNIASTASITALTQVDPVSPILNAFSTLIDSSSTQTHTFSSITPSLDNSAIIAFLEDHSGTGYSWNAPMVMESDLNSTLSIYHVGSSTALYVQGAKAAIQPVCISTASSTARKMIFSLKHV